MRNFFFLWCNECHVWSRCGWKTLHLMWHRYGSLAAVNAADCDDSDNIRQNDDEDDDDDDDQTDTLTAGGLADVGGVH